MIRKSKKIKEAKKLTFNTCINWTLVINRGFRAGGGF
jgi:hypothetical protein